MFRPALSLRSAILPRPGGFTLLEVLVSIAILLMLMGIMAAMVAVISPVVKRSNNTTNSFQQARAGFEALTQTLAQATLMTYWDYVDASGNPRTSANVSSFVPNGFKRASQLHFVSGLASAALLATGQPLVPNGGAATVTPGDAVFFQAPLGRSSNGSVYQPLNSSLNEIGFYVQFSDDSSDWPSFVSSGLGNDYRFRLMEWIPQTQNIHIYDSTLQSNYSLTWITSYLPQVGVSPGVGQDAPRVLAENVVLLVLLPKLTPEDELTLNGGAVANPGTLLCPNYAYDSRAWQPGYTTTGSGNGAVLNKNFGSSSFALAGLMRNQLPPLVDVAMIAISDTDALRLQRLHGSTLPPELAVSSTLFQNSTSLQSDLQSYEAQLTSNHISYKAFWSTVQIKGAKWSLN